MTTDWQSNNNPYNEIMRGQHVNGKYITKSFTSVLQSSIAYWRCQGLMEIGVEFYWPYPWFLASSFPAPPPSSCVSPSSALQPRGWLPTAPFRPPLLFPYHRRHPHHHLPLLKIQEGNKPDAENMVCFFISFGEDVFFFCWRIDNKRSQTGARKEFAFRKQNLIREMNTTLNSGKYLCFSSRDIRKLYVCKLKLDSFSITKKYKSFSCNKNKAKQIKSVTKRLLEIRRGGAVPDTVLIFRVNEDFPYFPQQNKVLSPILG